MSIELKKRIITSLILISITIAALFIHPYIFIVSIVLLSYTVFFEATVLFENIFKKNKKKLRYCFCLNGLSLFYIFIIFGSYSLVLYLNYGPIFFLFLLSISIFSDIGGFVFGKLFGGKKLTKISPNKTYSGTLGSLLLSVLPLFILSSFYMDASINSLKGIIFCLLISLITQIGDLFVSYLKRKAQLKDTGNILPGHGGILDRVDGIIFAVPFAHLLVLNFNFF